MKTDFQLAKGVFIRLVTCGIIGLFIYVIFNFALTSVSTKVVGARVYEIVDGEYNLIAEESFENKSDFAPPQGDQYYVQYNRSETPIALKIVGGILIQAILLFQLFRVLSAVLAQPGYRAIREGKDLCRGFRIGLIAAIPSFALYIAYVVATIFKFKLARVLFCVLNITFRPIMDLIFAFTNDPYSIINALFMIVIVAMIPLMTQFTFIFGQRYKNIDFKKLMYKKENK